MAKKKYYVVWQGRKPGIYSTWAECQKQTNGYNAAKFKGFSSLEEAESAYRDGWKKHWGKGKTTGSGRRKPSVQTGLFSEAPEAIDYNSISVDAGTHGNPGPVEYRGVDTKTGEVLFSYGPIEKGTNNLGEFLAIVHGLAYLKEQGDNKTIYSDSYNAIKWVREKKVSTTLVKDASTAEIWGLIERALKWLQENTYENKIVKWDTKRWGEIKADYGRK